MKAALVVFLGLTLVLSGLTPGTVWAQAPDQDPSGPSGPEPLLPAGHVAVFLIPYMHSVTGPTDRAVTAISITNVNGTTACPTSVEWRPGFSTSASCTTTFTLAGGTVASKIGYTAEHCSRNVPGDVVSCNAVCSPELTFIEGKAIVGTTTACVNRLAVDARLYKLNASDITTGVTALKVIRLPFGNKGE